MSLGLSLGLSLACSPGAAAATATTGPDFARFTSATLRLALLPSGIVAASESGGAAVTSWTDAAGLNTAAAPNGTPTLHLAGPARGVRFNGALDRLDGAVSCVDQPATLFVVCQTMTPEGSDRAWIFQMSDNGSADRSGGLYRLFTNAAVTQGQATEDGNASIVIEPTDPVVYRARFSTTARQMWINGEWASASTISGLPVRTATSYRLGQRLDGTKPLDCVIYAVLLYEGAMNTVDAEAADADLRELMGITAEPFRWPLTPATVSTGEPRFVVPVTTPAIVGQRVMFQEDGIHLRDGTVPLVTVTSDLPIEDDSPAGTWAVIPTSPGSYDLTFTEAGYAATTTIVAVAALAPTGSELIVAEIGDSNATRARKGWNHILEARLGARIRFVGTQGPNAPWTGKNDGIDSTTWAYWNSASSPLFTAGVMNIAAWVTALGATPGAVVFNLGQNDCSAAPSYEAVYDAFATAMGHAETIFAALKAELPTVKIFVVTNYPLATDPDAGAGSAAARFAIRSKIHLWCELTLDSFTGREVEDIYLVHTFPRLDCIRSYPAITPAIADSIHFNQSPGHEELADVFEAALVHHAY